MDTNLQENTNLIAMMKKEVLTSKMFEVFLESVPQFILQSYIILKTGNMSNFLLRF